MKRFFFITLLFIFKLFPTSSFSQVIIGDTISYKPGILLNLNETIKGGLLLSNVHITDLKRIPTGTDIFVLCSKECTGSEFWISYCSVFFQLNIAVSVIEFSKAFSWIIHGGVVPRKLSFCSLSATAGDSLLENEIRDPNTCLM